MKIGFVLDDSLDKTDGVQQYIITLGSWLAKQGHNVHYLVGETHRVDIPNIHSLSKNIAVRFNKNRMSMPLKADKSKIVKLLNDEQFDIIHVQMPYSPLMAGFVVSNVSQKTAVIGSFHIVPFNLLHNVAGRALGLYLKRNLRRFDAVIGASWPAFDYAKSSFRVKPVMIPNTVDSALYGKGKMIDKYNDGKINIVYLGRLVERKGCTYLLQAIKILHDKHQLMNVRVIICGKGPLDSELKDYVRDNRLSAVIHFVGFVNEADKPDYLASAHIAVFPSLGGECFGIVLIEAMAAGSEVVLGGNNIGYASILNARPSHLFSPQKVDEFANTLKHFIVNSRARKSAKSWQKTAVKQYDINVVGAQVMEIYKSSIAKRTH